MNSAKPRKVYKRHGVLHVCYDGTLFAPKDSTATEVSLELPVSRLTEFDAETIEGIETRCIQVFQAVPKRKGALELWYECELPAKGTRTRKPKVAKVAEVVEVAA